MIDICIPLYIKNRGILRDCVTAIVKNTTVDHRLLVCVDGGSPDDLTDVELLLREIEHDAAYCKGVQLLHNKKILYEAETVARLLDAATSEFVVVFPVMNELKTSKWWEILHTPFLRDSLSMLASNEPKSLWRNVPHYAMTKKDVIGTEAIIVMKLKTIKKMGYRFKDVDMFLSQRLVDEFTKIGGRCWSAPSIEPGKLPYENPPDLLREELDRRRSSTEVEVVL